MIGKTIGHYQIVEELGRGGMGVVYKARDLKLDRTVALKFLPSHPSSSGDGKARLVQEARSTAALNHPNILSVYDIDELDGSMFFVMEYVEGKTLKQHLTALKGEGLPLPQVLEWITQVAHGLKAAHEKGIVHRDIKPENIMIGPGGQVKIMDFGIAKLRGGTGLTKTGMSLGTVGYMSPEQAQGIPTDHRTDIWSLGVTLYEMLTGEAPFKAEHEAALLYLIVNQNPPVPSALDRRIPNPIDTLLQKLLEKDREKRYQNMDEVLKGLENARTQAQTGTGPGRRKAIAVLPFDNISPDKESDYFSDGLTEEIIANLQRLKDMRVVSRTSSMQYKETKKDIRTIGRELGVRYIMEGSVRRFQDNLRITAQLIDVEDDEQLWAETYKGTIADVFDIQEQVSKQIVDSLMVKLTPTEKVVLTKRATLDAEAFDCYLRARNFLYGMTRNSIQFSIQLFQKAIEHDPRYAGAYAGLGEAYAAYFRFLERQDIWLDRSIESSLKALMYDSSSSEAYTALALAYYLKNSLSDAFTAGQKAIELDPNNFNGYWILGRIYISMDRHQEALELFRKVVQLNPDFYSVYGDLQLVYGRLGDREQYNQTLHAALDVYVRYLSRHPDDARGHMYYAVDLAQAGRRDEAKTEAARALQLSPDDPLMLYNATCFYSQMGEKRLALDALKNAITAGYAEYEWLKRDVDLDSIRNEPEYLELIKDK